MKNLTLCFLVLGIMLVMIGGVSANGSGDINVIIYPTGIISPSEGSYVSGEVLISWENMTFGTALLGYKKGGCDGAVINKILDGYIIAEGEYLWDTDTPNTPDGNYCIKIVWGSEIYGKVSIIVDNTPPEIEFIGAPYFAVKEESINITANIIEENGIKEWEIDFGDGSTVEEGITEEVIGIHAYDEEGEYEVTLIVKDKAGNTATETAMVMIKDEKPEWIIPLYADKMNLFSIPLMPESTDIKDVLGKDISDNAEKIWSYQQGSWKYNTPTSSGWSSTSTRIQKIVPGYGYIIFMNEDTIAYGNGKELGAETPTEKIKLAAGWNLIGLRGTESKPIGTALLGLKSVLSGTPYWISIIDKDGVDVNYLNPKEAYWIDMNSNDFLNPEDKIFLY